MLLPGVVQGIAGFPLVGALIISRRPHNPIGWICLADGLLWMLIFTFESYSAYGVAQPHSLWRSPR